MKSELTLQEARAFKFMQTDGLESIDRRYGPNSKNHKKYHNADHPRNIVRPAVEAICRLAGVPIRERKLLEHAAIYHDYFNGIYRGLDEELSAKAAVRAMEETGVFYAADSSLVRWVIPGTACQLEGPHIYQKAAEMDEYAQILADADLAAIGMPPEISWPSAISLHEEFYPDMPLVGGEIIKLAQFEIEVQRNHTYFTSEAQELFPHKHQNIDYLQSIIDGGGLPS